jgi:tRNA A-37 threonylcarbamoyl transferase component Bud32
MKNIGKYEILDELGKGGFGTVYRGRDTVLKRLVAIKVCSSDSDNIRARFQREAEIVASLQHPNITTIYDLGVHDGLPYLVQELLSGEDLSGPIERKEPMPLDRKLGILADVARGLEHAHANEIIHRDIKPGNIRLLEDGSVKVMDFGIAKLASFETKLTKTGMMVGTAAYLAPEQIDDATIDARCDIFSYGVLAYELLAYQRPFDASTVSALLFQILHRPHVSLATRSPEVPPTLAALVDRCLEKDRERRPQSFTEIRAELAELGAGTGPIARPASRERAVGANGGARPDSSTSARTVVASGGVPRDSRDLGVHAAETRAYESGSTPVLANGSPVAPPARHLPDIPTIPLGSVPKLERAAPQRLPKLGAAAVLLLALGIVAWWAVSSRETAISSAVAPAGDAVAREAAAREPDAAPDDPADPEHRAASGAGEEGDLDTPLSEGSSLERTAAAEPTPPRIPPASRDAETDSGGSREVVERRPAPAVAPAATATEPAASAPARAEPSETPPARQEVAQPVERRVESESGSPARQPDAVPQPPSATAPAADPRNGDTAAPLPAPVDHDAEIRRALDRYRRAYEQLDARLLAEVWPSLGRDELERIERSFQSFESVQVSIEGCRIDVQGARATASCLVRRAVQPKAGRPQSIEQQTTFRLVRSGESWVLEGL